MWKGVAIILSVLGWNYRSQVEIPTFPNEYWGPGKPISDPKDIKPFKINISKEVLNDLHVRLNNTRNLVEPLEGTAWTYGFSSSYLKLILKYWSNSYDWDQRQELLNKYPQFTTKIQGLDIHFYHIKPKIPKHRPLRVLPMLLLHGWPGSVVEFQKIIPLLSQPQPDKDFVFELVIPSLPGFGFSKPAVRPGLGPPQIAVILKNLMSRLGFEQFYTQGGDVGSIISSNLAVLFPKNLLGMHLNTCIVNSIKAHIFNLFSVFLPYLAMGHDFNWLFEKSCYFHIQATKPDTIGTALTDSPAGLAAYILENISMYTDPENQFRNDGGLLDKFRTNELLDNVMIYWVTGSITTSQRLLAEGFSENYRNLGVEGMMIEVPTGCTAFHNQLVYQPEIILRERYVNMIQMTLHDQGGHLAAFEEPELLATDIWKFVFKNEQFIAEHKKKEREKQQQPYTRTH